MDFFFVYNMSVDLTYR